MTEVFLDNPAGRLHAFLTAIKGYQTPGAGVSQALPVLLGVKPSARADIARKLAAIFEMPEQVRQAIRAIGDEESEASHLGWVTNVNNAFNALLFPTGSIQSVGNIYGEGDLTRLEFCSLTLHKHRMELPLNADTLTTIREQAAELAEMLESDTEMDSNLKKLLLHHVRLVIRACEDFDLFGVQGIRDAFDRMVGAMATHPHDVVHHDSSPGTYAKFIALTTAIGAALQLGAAGLGIIPALDPPRPDRPAVVVENVLPAGGQSRQLEAPAVHPTGSAGQSPGNGRGR